MTLPTTHDDSNGELEELFIDQNSGIADEQFQFIANHDKQRLFWKEEAIDYKKDNSIGVLSLKYSKFDNTIFYAGYLDNHFNSRSYDYVPRTYDDKESFYSNKIAAFRRYNILTKRELDEPIEQSKSYILVQELKASIEKSTAKWLKDDYKQRRFSAKIGTNAYSLIHIVEPGYNGLKVTMKDKDQKDFILLNLNRNNTLYPFLLNVYKMMKALYQDYGNENMLLGIEAFKEINK